MPRFPPDPREASTGFGSQWVSARPSPNGVFSDFGDVIIGVSPTGVPLYLRDGVDVIRGYESPPRYLNYYSVRDERGWHRSRAITLAIQMRPGATPFSPPAGSS